mmetsp:Transcript_104713/g.312781  ORF Transcript_104713/g.312781 Transcript_104713/m.312781 type:complete len:398 (-) Transcript_104713:1460-2653(-)
MVMERSWMGKTRTVVPLGSIMFSFTSSFTGLGGNSMLSGVRASRTATSLRRTGGPCPSSGFGIDPRYFSSSGSSVSLGGRRPTSAKVHSQGRLAHSLKMALARLKSSLKMLHRLGSRANGWSCVMQRCRRRWNCAWGSRFSLRRQAKRLNLTNDKRLRDFVPGSTGRLNSRCRSSKRLSKSIGEADASKPVWYASSPGGFGSSRFPSRHSCIDSMDIPQIPSIIATMEQTCASVVMTPFSKKPLVWCSERPPQRRARSTISSSKRSVCWRKTRKPFFKMTSTPSGPESAAPSASTSFAGPPRAGLGTPSANTSLGGSPTPGPAACSACEVAPARLATQASKFLRNRESTSSSSCGQGSRGSAAATRMISATSELSGRSSFGRGATRLRQAWKRLQKV